MNPELYSKTTSLGISPCILRALRASVVKGGRWWFRDTGSHGVYVLRLKE
jgi:hypothetical protein